MIEKRKLVSLIVIIAMVITMVPERALAAEKAENVDMANLESQLFVLDETAEQRNLIEVQSNKLKNLEQREKSVNAENLENQENTENQGNTENQENAENQGNAENPDNAENSENPKNPEEPSISIKTIDKIPMQLWNKDEVAGVKPEIVVRDEGGKIVKKEFYEVVWENNKGVGKAKVTVNGINGSEGSACREFYIVSSFTPKKLKIDRIETDLGRAKIYFKGTSVGDMKIRYEVRCKKVGSRYDESYNFQSSKGYVIVNGLEHNKRYEFRVKAYYFNDEDEFVDGPLSNKVVKWTNRLGNKQQTIVKAGFTKGSLGKSSVKLKWKKIKLADSPKTKVGYRIIFRIKGYSNYRYVDTRDLVKTFYHLDRGVDYQFKVKYYYTSKLDGKRVYSNPSTSKNVRLSFKVNKVLDVARSWLGRSERNGGHKYIINLYNSYKPLARGYKVKYSDEWCATTVSAMFIKAKAVSLPGGTECSVQRYIDIYKKRGVWEEDGRIKPKAGYVITYNWDDSSQKGGNNGWADHIGIVEKVKGNKITVIEGNYGEKVGRRVIPVGWGYIRGYAKLNYASKSTIWNSK